MIPITPNTKTWVLLGILISPQGLAVEANRNPHELVNADWTAPQQKQLCKECHHVAPDHQPQRSTRSVLPDVQGYIADGVSMCTSCHDEGPANHMVGAQPDFPVPADLPLDGERRITCLTCHHTHGSLKSDRPWCTVSLLDRLFGRERLHKTYLLRRNNTDGELCKACHYSDGENNP